MRLPKWNLRLSTAMLMVAAFAMGIAADRWKGRWDHCMARAEFYRAKALESRKEAAVMDGWVKRISQGISELYFPAERISQAARLSSLAAAA
jgi:hypothetical protein